MTMNPIPSQSPLTRGQLVVRVCLSLVAAIAFLGGSLQMALGQPDTTPRLDNVHRFLAGVYLGTGLISAWAAVTVRQQRTLVYLISLGILMAGSGRLISIGTVGLPQPAALWLGYLVPETLIPIIMVGAQYWDGLARSRPD
jgi:hypothetical protein